MIFRLFMDWNLLSRLVMLLFLVEFFVGMNWILKICLIVDLVCNGVFDCWVGGMMVGIMVIELLFDNWCSCVEMVLISLKFVVLFFWCVFSMLCSRLLVLRNVFIMLVCKCNLCLWMWFSKVLRIWVILVRLLKLKVFVFFLIECVVWKMVLSCFEFGFLIFRLSKSVFIVVRCFVVFLKNIW